MQLLCKLHVTLVVYYSDTTYALSIMYTFGLLPVDKLQAVPLICMTFMLQ